MPPLPPALSPRWWGSPPARRFARAAVSAGERGGGLPGGLCAALRGGGRRASGPPPRRTGVPSARPSAPPRFHRSASPVSAPRAGCGGCVRWWARPAQPRPPPEAPRIRARPRVCDALCPSPRRAPLLRGRKPNAWLNSTGCH